MSNSPKSRTNEFGKHVHDGFVYAREKVSKDRDRIFWQCVNKKGDKKCSGRIHTTSDGERTFVKLVTEHNCSYRMAATSANFCLQKSDGEAKKRALGEAQIISRQAQPQKSGGEQDLAFAVGTYAASIRSMDELFGLVQGNVGDDPIDFTNLNELQHPIFIREMARKMEKLRMDFEQMDCSECCHCGKQIEKITTENLAMVHHQLEGTAPTGRESRDWHRIVQTANRDSECASLAIHTFLYHPTELWPTLRCLFGSESDALNCYPYLDYRKSSPDLFVCFICRRNYSDLISFLRHSEMYHEARIGNFH